MNPKRIVACDIDSLIVEIRGQKVILDAGLASIYGVATRVLNQAVKRNAERFPPEFAFALTREEILGISQNVISLARLKYSKQVQAFTEHGAIMAANVLRSRRAIQMSVFVIRAFVKMRSALKDTRELARKLAALEQELKGRLDIHEAAIVDVLQRIMRILDPPPEPPAPAEPPKPEIGFHIHEEPLPYRIRRRPARL